MADDADLHRSGGIGRCGLARTSSSVRTITSVSINTIKPGATVQAISIGMLPYTCGGSVVDVPPASGCFACDGETARANKTARPTRLPK